MKCILSESSPQRYSIYFTVTMYMYIKVLISLTEKNNTPTDFSTTLEADLQVNSCLAALLCQLIKSHHHSW